MSATASSQVFESVRTIGGLLPADMLIRIADGKDVSGSRPADYHVVGVRSVRDAAERHWDYLKGAWRKLRETLGTDHHDAAGQAVANWLLPMFDELGFGRLQHTPEGIASSAATATFPVTHRWRHVPVHLVPWNSDLDKRPAGGGLPPQSMLQDCLNRTEDHLWAVLSNGRQLRLLRDSSALAGTAYIEIDLTAMFDGELFDEFILLYRLLHVSRFEIPDGAVPSACWLEKWRTEAIEAGLPFLNQLRDAVVEAVSHLGTGFLRHPANARLREDLDTDLYKRALLRLIYRLLFWFVTEERGALLDPAADQAARDRYQRYYSAVRLRTAALRRTGTSHGDQWQAVKLVLNALGNENGLPRLGLTGLGGIYDTIGTDQILHGLELSNEHLLAAIKSLARVRDESTKRWRKVDYRSLGSEELGSIYQSLLEFVPKWSKEERRFLLDVLPGNERKKTGSYYTPTSLIDCLLDSALDPVLDDAAKRAEIEATRTGADPAMAVVDALLAVTVCDPACGSGHFLVAAARRIAKRLASVREHNPEPTTEALRTAVRDVIKNCIYGVDVNPLAVELAKVSLWLEAVEPGKALSFLDAHVKVGDALIGATPALIDDGIPDDAFKAIEGDDPKWAAYLKKANAKERQGQLGMFGADEPSQELNTDLAAQLTLISDAPATSLAQVHWQAAAYQTWLDSPENARRHEIADAWCAAIIWRKAEDAPPAITYARFEDLTAEQPVPLPSALHTEVARLKAEFGFFHWYLEFPDIFHTPGTGPDGWSGGFSCVLANPPWDKVRFEDKKYFASVEPSIAKLAGVKRRSRIEEWQLEDSDRADRYRAARRKLKAAFHFAGDSGSFPLCARGLTEPGVNALDTDQLFTERFAAIIDPAGRAGCVIPTAIATGAGGQHLFRSFTARGAIVSLFDFENSNGQFFEGVHSEQRFCLLTFAGKANGVTETRFALFLLDTADLDNPDRMIKLRPDDINLINPNTGTIPIFQTRLDAELTARIYRRIPVLWDEMKRDGNPWGIRVKNLFNSTDDSDLFRTRTALETDGWHLEGNIFTKAEKRMLPVYEGKMAHLFDHRWNTFYDVGTDDRRRLNLDEKRDPSTLALPRYWVAEAGAIPAHRNDRDVEVPGVLQRLAKLGWKRTWTCGWRNITNANNERTAIPVIFPHAAATETLPLALPTAAPIMAASLIAAQSSLIVDYVSRKKVSDRHMRVMTWKQLPVPSPSMLEPHTNFITSRVLELVYTAYDMTPLARDLGDADGPFHWDEERRFLIRAELDAFFFRLYGIERDDVDYIMETFPIVKQHDVADHGSFRTKEAILTVYDRMVAADAAGAPYQTSITPPPGHGERHLARPQT